MRYSVRLLTLFGAALWLASCRGTTSPALPSSALGVAPGARGGAAQPACSGTRSGQAQCDVLVEAGGAHYASAGFSAADLETAYRFPITRGQDQTVAVVDAYDNPNAADDFATYRSTMGLSAGTLNKYNQEGEQGNYPPASAGWGVEIDLDIEMVSASCPNCTVDLIEANSNSWSDLEAAEGEAITLGATIVSNSFDGTGASESSFETKGITYVASAGDDGYGLYDPAGFDRVVAVGGTMLSQANNRRGYKEILWPDSGGGCVSQEKKPRWQMHRKVASKCAGRLGNDVSADAVGAREYDTYNEGGWIEVDGTSISAPLLAGAFGLAENSTKQDGGRTFWETAHHRFLHELGGKRFSDGGGWGSPHGIGAF